MQQQPTKTSRMLREKTNEDYNKKQPDPANPNEIIKKVKPLLPLNKTIQTQKKPL